MKRFIFNELKRWRQKKGRKPLILKGARQTGKTWVLKEFGEREFPACHYLNFEGQEELSEMFARDLDPKRIVNQISLSLGRSIDINHDLLIFDEIQACPKALTSLKYFAEEMPELALCSAGSLLGLHLGEASFPVGKVDMLHMFPMCFAEFLEASGDAKYVSFLDQCKSSDVIPAVVHSRLWDKFKIYLAVGGLPEVVATWQQREDLFSALEAARQKQLELVRGYYADIAKHAGKVNAMHIDRVWQAIPSQLAQSQDGSAKRFQFKGIVRGVDKYQRLANVFDWLKAAELVIRVPVIEHAELPLMAWTKENRFKLYMFDVGILGALADLPPKAILDYDYGTYKGYYAENFVAQEFRAKNIAHLYGWQDGRSEVEFLYTSGTSVIPVEVKSGWVTRSQSLQKFAAKYHPPYRAIFSAKTLCIDQAHHYHQYPLYMAYWFPIEN